MKPTMIAQTPPLYQIHDQYVSSEFKDAEEVKVPGWLKNPAPANPSFEDPALQLTYGPMISVNQGLSFDGIGESFTGPNGTYSVEASPLGHRYGHWHDTGRFAGQHRVCGLQQDHGRRTAGSAEYQHPVVVTGQRLRVLYRKRWRRHREVRSAGAALDHHPVRTGFQRHRTLLSVRGDFADRRRHRLVDRAAVHARDQRLFPGLSEVGCLAGCLLDHLRHVQFDRQHV